MLRLARKEEIERDYPNGLLVQDEEEKSKTQFPMDNKKNNVRRETESEEESSFGSAKQFVFRDSFALIQSGFGWSHVKIFIINCLDSL